MTTKKKVTNEDINVSEEILKEEIKPEVKEKEVKTTKTRKKPKTDKEIIEGAEVQAETAKDIKAPKARKSKKTTSKESIKDEENIDSEDILDDDSDTDIGKKVHDKDFQMAVVKKLIELQKGEITIESKEDIGTKVTLTFPIVESNCT